MTSSCWKLLIEYGADVNIKCLKTWLTPLHEASLYGHSKCVYQLICAGANVSAVASSGLEGATPLHLASKENHVDCIEVLLSAGADIRKTNLRNQTALLTATVAGHVEAVDLLLDAGSEAIKSTAYGCTALFGASNLEVAKLLMKRGVPATVVDSLGRTVLHCAASRGEGAALLCLFFKAGTDPTLRNLRGMTAADVARFEGHMDTAKMLDMLEAKYRDNKRREEEEKTEDTAGVKELDQKVGSLNINEKARK